MGSDAITHVDPRQALIATRRRVWAVSMTMCVTNDDVRRWAYRLRVTFIAAGVSFAPDTVSAQEIGPVTFRDSLVMRQLAFRTPCPSPIPRAWSMVDTTLGQSPRCTLLEVAARAIARYLQARPQADGGDPWTPLCVRVIVRRNSETTALPLDWWVVFDLTADTPAWVVIDRHTGEIGMTVVGKDLVRDWPRCLAR